ncbi:MULTISPECIES: hypothetical protein [unclassified Bradyrhizobium]|uniref:hypothetical protein n=1 Tax=unclassified Bradyrhizobium TaxID=2631580 RepID=UPI00247953AF|nr:MULTISPECIES: hypothetical protein [unclassified Bradyrhizobium]WGR73197.1 hypothetical protein MTX24_10355 [Bradyrhizobium sp. ISRA426]WGR78036.1 hypothetical protein MTX21_35325 [Bradyrhizobium sp. ISRA430]WGR88437.1 hypothetical protein MTX25_10365 [Bradyrhizobium sp. ISRA432]
MANTRPKRKPRKPKSVAAGDVFAGTTSRTISRDEIYHRLEWYFDKSHDPHGPHTIPSATPISALLHNLGLEDLYVNLCKASQMYVPAWNSQLFHGVAIPWISKAGIAIGIKDVKTMGDLINSFVLSYKHAGWQVTEG